MRNLLYKGFYEQFALDYLIYNVRRVNWEGCGVGGKEKLFKQSLISITMIIACSHGKHLAKKISKKLKQPYLELESQKFPDSEIYLRFQKDIKNKTIILIQSFYKEISDCLIEVLFAAQTAKDLGAKKIILIAPYFPYLRQDKRFRKGEIIPLEIIAKYINNCINEIYIIDPHLHRKNTLKEIFKTKSHKLTANSLIAQYIKEKIKNPLIIGPDFESHRWAKETAKLVNCLFFILNKKRLSSRKVKIATNKNLKKVKNKNVVIVDDIISTGHTILETIKLLKKQNPKSITCVCVHGIFAENALEKIKKTGARIISCNTIPNKVGKIDVSGLIAENL